MPTVPTTATEQAATPVAPSSPRSPVRRRPAPPGDDDPASELNSLRRELRRAQAALREMGLQSAQQQDEIIALRKELSEVEMARDDALARESALRTRLVAERQRVDATMAAAENLINVLRSMDDSDLGTMDAPETNHEAYAPPPTVPVPVVTFEDLRVSPHQPTQQDSPVHPDNIRPLTQNAQPELPPQLYPAEPRVTRTRSTPSLRPRSSHLLASAFSGGPHSPPVSAVQRASTTAVPTAAEVPAVPAVTETRIPIRVESVQSDAHAGEIFCAASSLDGSLLATGGDDRQIRVISLRAPSAPVFITEPPKSVTALEFFPDDAPTAGTSGHAPLLCAGTSDGAVRVFRRAPKRRTRWTLDLVSPVHTQTVRRIVFRPGAAANAVSVLTASLDRSVKVTDLRAGTRVFVGNAPSAALDVAVFPGGVRPEFVSVHRDGAIRVWSASDKSEPVIEALRVHARAAISVAPMEDGRGVVSLGRDNAIRVSDTRMNLRVVREFENGVDTLSDWHRVVVDSRLAFCGIGPSGDLGVWNIDSGKLVKRLSSIVQTRPKDVIDLVAKSFSNPAAVVVPLWTTAGRFVCAHKTRQVSFWQV